jgi:integrase
VLGAPSLGESLHQEEAEATAMLSIGSHGSPAAQPNERRTLRDLPPLPAKVTAHSLRRTYISMMCAAGAEIPYVTAQIGHGDSKVTWRSTRRS